MRNSLLLGVLLWGGLGIFQAGVWAIEDHIQESQRLLSAGNLDGAEREAKLALSSPITRALAWAMLGTIRLQQKRTDEGIQYLKKAIRLNSRLVGARLNLGAAYFQLGKTAEARKAYQEALQLEPDSATARFDLAQLEAAAGNHGTSLRLAEPIISTLHESPEGLLVLATDYLGLKATSSLEPLVSEWKNLKGIPEQQSLKFANILSKSSLVPDAIDVLSSYLSTEKTPSFELSFALGNLYLRKGNTKLASDYYETALRLQSECVPCLQGLASVAKKQGETEKALAYLIQARRKKPDDPEVLFEFGKVCLERDLFDDAVAALQRAVALRPDNDHYTYVLASAYVSTGRHYKALPLLEGLVKKRPNDAVLQYSLGAVSYLQGDFDAAETSLRKSIELSADQVGAYYYLGLTAERKKDYEKAEGIFDDLLKRHPEHTPSYVELGTVLVALRKHTAAQSVLEEVIRRDPSSVQAHYQLGILFGRLGRQGESDKEIAVARKLEKERTAEIGKQLRLLPGTLESSE